MQTITPMSATDDQIELIRGLSYAALETAIADLNLSNIRAQRVIEGGDEIAANLRNAITATLDGFLAVANLEGETRPRYEYPKGFRPLEVTEQTRRLRQVFPSLGLASERIAQGKSLGDADGWFAIPKWQTLGATYQQALEEVLAKIAETRTDGFHNRRKGHLGPDHLRQTERTKIAFERLSTEQGGFDILLLPAQFGILHRGQSVCDARSVFRANEFGLGAFAVAIMILLHPERFGKYEDLCVDCAGDDYGPDFGGEFTHAPIFRWRDGMLIFDAYGTCLAHEYFGSASGFGSQYHTIA